MDTMELVQLVVVGVEVVAVAILAVGVAFVLIRTFLSWSAQLETSGYWPWQKAAEGREGV